MTKESQEWTMEKYLRSARVNLTHTYFVWLILFQCKYAFEFNNVNFYAKISTQSLATDVPTQRVCRVIKRWHLCKQFVKQPVILVIGTELKTFLLLIFSHKVQLIIFSGLHI